MRKLVYVLIVMAVAATASANPPMWGSLQRGPYAVGYRLIDRYDYTRPYWTARDLEHRPRTIERARPMRISAWYPAMPSTAPAMTLGAYIDLMGAEDRIVPIGEAEKRAGRAALSGLPVGRKP